jgi:hypothetical protein
MEIAEISRSDFEAVRKNNVLNKQRKEQLSAGSRYFINTFLRDVKIAKPEGKVRCRHVIQCLQPGEKPHVCYYEDSINGCLTSITFQPMKA